MNLLKQILAFNQRQMSNPLSAGQFILWHALLNVHNDCGKQEWFTVANLRLELFTGLSRQGIDKARNTLKQLGFIEYKSNGTKATAYKINLLYNDSLQDSLPVSLQGSSQAVGKEVSEQLLKELPNGWQNSGTLNKEKESKEKESKSNNISAKLLEKQFNALWDIYPRKERKNDAFKAYSKAIKKGVENTTIQNGLQSYIDYVKANQTETKYIKQGGTWFSQECWNDEYKIESYPKTNFSSYPTKARGYVEPLPDWAVKEQNEKRTQRGVNWWEQ